MRRLIKIGVFLLGPMLFGSASCSDSPKVVVDGPAPSSEAGAREASAGDVARPDDLPRPDASASIPGEWATVQSGKFLMGSPKDELCREPWSLRENQREVTLTHSFEIMTTEVTQSHFKSVMGYNPSIGVNCGDDCPVDTVSWYEAVVYANKLSASKGVAACYYDLGSGAVCATSSECSIPKREACVFKKCVRYEVSLPYQAGKIYTCPGYRLPTEAEWEYAYRAGTTTPLYSGPIVPGGTNPSQPCDGCWNDDNVAAIGWYCKNSVKSTLAGQETQRVGQKKPNDWGLLDMAGNVNEWTTTWIEKPSVNPGYDPITDPSGPEEGTNRIIRGGSAFSWAGNLRAANRDHAFPYEGGKNIGFRLVRTLNP